MKQCRTCAEAKPLSEFYAHEFNQDGRFSSCKACVRTYNRERKRAIRKEEGMRPCEKAVFNELFSSSKTVREIAFETDYSDNAVSRALHGLVRSGHVMRVGPLWVLIKKEVAA